MGVRRYRGARVPLVYAPGGCRAVDRDDGTDEALQIQECFDENLFVEVDEPPAGVGYGIGSATAWKGVTMRSGHEIYGPGLAPGKFLRVGRWKLEQILLRNQNHDTGNTGIKLHNILIDGRRGAVGEGIPARAKDNNTTGVMFKVVDTAGEKLSNIAFTNVEIRNWPGIAMRTFNAKHVDFQDSKISNPARGGFRFTGACYDVNLLRCVAEDVGESAFGLWVSNVVLSDPDKDIIAGDMHDFLLTDCRSNVRKGAEFGSALMLWGARRITARGCTFGPSKNDVIHINSDTSTRTEYVPQDILIERCKMLGGKSNSFKILADFAQRITVRDSLMSKPAEYCLNVSPWGKRRIRAFRDVRITGNTFVKSGRGYVKINEKIKGVVAKRNRRR